MKKLAEFREKSLADLDNKLLELLKEQFKLRIIKANDGDFTKNHKFREVRRDIARVKTILAERRVVNTASSSSKADANVTDVTSS